VTEQDYIAALKARWPQKQTASREILSLACLAVRDFPHSAMLWFLRGQLILLAPENYIFSKLDAICSFDEAIRLDPTLTEACKQMGHRHGGMEDDPKGTIKYDKAAKPRDETLD
jgi:hypothetical protein